MIDRSYWGMHRLPRGGGYYVARLDVDEVCDAPADLLQRIAQSHADRAAWADERFYYTHILDTPEGRLHEQRELCRVVGYTTHQLPALTEDTRNE